MVAAVRSNEHAPWQCNARVAALLMRGLRTASTTKAQLNISLPSTPTVSVFLFSDPVEVTEVVLPAKLKRDQHAMTRLVLRACRALLQPNVLGKQLVAISGSFASRNHSASTDGPEICSAVSTRLAVRVKQLLSAFERSYWTANDADAMPALLCSSNA